MKITKKNISASITPAEDNQAPAEISPAVKDYANELGELTVETLLADYYTYASSDVTDTELRIKVYTDSYKSAVWTVYRLPLEDITPNQEDLESDAEYLAYRIEEGLDDDYTSIVDEPEGEPEADDVLEATAIPQEDDVYGDTESKRWQDSWQYKRIIELGYIVDVTDDSVTIKFDDGDVYANFKLIPPDNPSDPYDEWMAKDSYGDIVSTSFDYTDSYDEIVTGCLYYFLTRY